MRQPMSDAKQYDSANSDSLTIGPITDVQPSRAASMYSVDRSDFTPSSAAAASAYFWTASAWYAARKASAQAAIEHQGFQDVAGDVRAADALEDAGSALAAAHEHDVAYARVALCLPGQ